MYLIFFTTRKLVILFFIKTEKGDEYLVINVWSAFSEGVVSTTSIFNYEAIVPFFLEYNLSVDV